MHLLLLLIFLLLAPTILALDPIVSGHGRLIHKNTGLEFSPAGVLYITTNDTSGTTDSLSDPDACLRDAALFQRLGLNFISTSYLSVNASHDDCMSIFNSAGIYVAIGLDEFLGSWGDDLDASYSSIVVERAFRLIDAFKDYENTLLFTFTNGFGAPQAQYGHAQPYLRAMTRDLRMYMTEHVKRSDVPLGFGLHHSLSRSDGQSVQLFHDYATCIIDGEEISSRIDFMNGVVLALGGTREDPDGVPYLDEQSFAPFINLSSFSIPFGLSLYREFRFDGEGFETVTSNFSITALLHHASTVAESIVGGSVYMWANTNLRPFTAPDDGLVELDSKGNLQMRESYENYADMMLGFNPEQLRNGVRLTRTTTNPPCSPVPTELCTATSMPCNDSWVLPTPPPGVEAMISSGVGGQVGKHVNLTNTLVPQTIIDASGQMVTGLAITPSPGTFISTPETSPNASPSAPSNNSLRIGLGVGIPAAVLALAGLILAYRFHHRKRSPKDDGQPVFTESSNMPDLPELEDVHAHFYSSELPAARDAGEVHGHDKLVAEMDGSPGKETAQELHNDSRSKTG